MNRKSAIVASLACLALSATSALAEDAKKPAAGEQVLANINGTVITAADFEAKYESNSKFFQFKAPSRKAVLEDIIRRELAIQEARKLGVDKDPVVQERVNTVLFQSLLDRELAKDLEKITISDDEAKGYYQKNPEIRTSHLFVALRQDAKGEEEAAATKRIKDLQEDLKKGASFAELAQTRSDGPAAPLGGDIDYKHRGELDSAYYSAALALGKPGKVSGIVRTPFGLHLIKLTAIRSWDDADRGQVKREIFEQRRAALFDKYMGRLRKDGKVTINTALLKD